MAPFRPPPGLLVCGSLLTKSFPALSRQRDPWAARGGSMRLGSHALRVPNPRHGGHWKRSRRGWGQHTKNQAPQHPCLGGRERGLRRSIRTEVSIYLHVDAPLPAQCPARGPGLPGATSSAAAAFPGLLQGIGAPTFTPSSRQRFSSPAAGKWILKIPICFRFVE